MTSDWKWESNDDWESECPWPDDYNHRKDTLLRDGLDVRISFAVSDDFIALNVQILNGVLLRDKSHSQLHVTLGFVGEIPDQLLEQVKARWDNVQTHLTASRVGGGGSVIIGDCPLGRCPLVSRAHGIGYYSDRELHLSM